MTMVAACRFVDGAVIIADSRATWDRGGTAIFEDSLQKIVPLAPKIGIAFSGDVKAAALVIDQLRWRIQTRRRSRVLRKLAADVPRIARHYYELHKSRTQTDYGLSLVLAGVTETGQLEISWYESPNFGAHKLTEGSVVVGSGKVVSAYLDSNMERLNREPADLKARADALLIGLEAELGKQNIETVGGLFQIVLLDHGGIRPLRYGFVDLNPAGPPRAKDMEMRRGQWIQRDLAAGRSITLLEPASLVSKGPTPVRVHDLTPQAGKPDPPAWHLSYFVTCMSAQIQSDVVEFRGTLTIAGAPEYPLSIPLLIAVGFWGSEGDQEVSVILEKDAERREIGRHHVHVKFLPEEVDIIMEATIVASSPGPAFLECWVSGQLLGRKALYFGTVADASGLDDKEVKRLGEQEATRLLDLHRQCSDPVVESTGDSALVYLSPCQGCSDQGMVLRFERPIAAVYASVYPVQLRVFVATAFRMPLGPHRVRVDLVNTSTRLATPLASAESVESNSSCIVTPLHGEVVATVPQPGWYFVNAHIDGKLVGSSLLAAENQNAQYSYTLPAEELARVAKGEVLVLLKRSQQKRSNGGVRS